MSQLKIKLLGSLEIYLDGEAITWFPTDRVRALFLLLAVEPAMSQQRSTIASLLWSDSDDAAARRNLRRCLSRLKGALGDDAEAVLEASRHSIGLLSAESDYQQFQRLSSSDDAADWQKAVDLINGELAEGFHLKNSTLFDDWLAELRLTLAHQQRDLLHKLLDTITVNPQARLSYALRLAALDPYDDATQRAVMSLHVEMGNVPAAMAHYEAYVETLQQELSAEPEIATRTLYVQLEAATASNPVELINFPAQITPFVGREAERKAVIARLQAADCRMVTLLGAGGAGKTRLSIETVRYFTTDLFSDGVYFVPLVTATTAHEVLAIIHRTLALPTQGTNIEEQVFDYLSDKRLLLLLDNVEQLSGELGFLSRLLQEAAGVKLLVTSRDVVGISAEYRIPLAGLSDLKESTALLWGAIQRIEPNFDLNATNFAIGARICEQLHGVPLALELAATWISTLDLDSIRAEVEEAYTFLESPLLDTPDRHRSLRAIFEHSWELLTPQRQMMLAKASIFSGGFDMPAARHIFGAGINDLRRLLEQSLLIKQENNRYGLHELVRQFAAEKLSAADADAIRQAHATYYLALVAKNEHQLVSENALVTTKLISADLPNITRAWRWAVKHSAFEQLGATVTGLTHFYRLTARLSEGDQLYVETLAALDKQVDNELLAQLHVGCAHFRMWQSRHDESVESAECALAIAQRGENSDLIAESQLAIGRSLRALGKLMVAIQTLHQGLAACIGNGSTTRALRADILANLALISSYGIAPSAGQELAAQGVAEAQQSSNKMTEAYAFTVASYAYLRVGRISDALNTAQAGMDLVQSMGYMILQAAGVANFARVQLILGNVDEAETVFHQSIKSYRSVGDELGEVQALAGVCQSSFNKAAYVELYDYAERSLALAEANNMGLQAGHALYWKGLALLGLRKLDEAEAALKEIQKMRVALKLEGTFTGQYLFALAAIALARGSAEKGRDMISSSVDQYLKNNPDPWFLVRNCLLGYPILKAAQDPRAEKFLKLGYDYVMQSADAIENPEHRQIYLEQSRPNRELIALYETL